MPIVAETCAGQRNGIPHPPITHDEIACPMCLLLENLLGNIEEVECDLRVGALASTKEAQEDFRNVEKELAKLLPDVVANTDTELFGLLTTLGRSIDEAVDSVTGRIEDLAQLQ